MDKKILTGLILFLILFSTVSIVYSLRAEVELPPIEVYETELINPPSTFDLASDNYSIEFSLAQGVTDFNFELCKDETCYKLITATKDSVISSVGSTGVKKKLSDFKIENKTGIAVGDYKLKFKVTPGSTKTVDVTVVDTSKEADCPAGRELITDSSGSACEIGGSKPTVVSECKSVVCWIKELNKKLFSGVPVDPAPFEDSSEDGDKDITAKGELIDSFVEGGIPISIVGDLGFDIVQYNGKKVYKLGFEGVGEKDLGSIYFDFSDKSFLSSGKEYNHSEYNIDFSGGNVSNLGEEYSHYVFAIYQSKDKDKINFTNLDCDTGFTGMGEWLLRIKKGQLKYCEDDKVRAKDISKIIGLNLLGVDHLFEGKKLAFYVQLEIKGNGIYPK